MPELRVWFSDKFLKADRFLGVGEGTLKAQIYELPIASYRKKLSYSKAKLGRCCSIMDPTAFLARPIVLYFWRIALISVFLNFVSKHTKLFDLLPCSASIGVTHPPECPWAAVGLLCKTSKLTSPDTLMLRQPRRLVCLPGELQLITCCISSASGCLFDKPLPKKKEKHKYTRLTPDNNWKYK